MGLPAPPRRGAARAARVPALHARRHVGRRRDEARRIYREGKRGAGEVAAHAEEYYDEVSGMVRRNPAQALGIAAGVGFLLGLIIARR